MSARIIGVIETQLYTRGKGTEDNPFRSITQYWSKDGNLLAEADPYQDESPRKQMVRGAEIDETLIRGAMLNVRNPSNVDFFAWALVRDTFGIGSTRAKELCVAYSVDPDAKVKHGERVHVNQLPEG